MCAPITVLIALKAPPKVQTTITDCAAAMPSIQRADGVESLAAQSCLALGARGAWRLPMWPVELQQSFRACPLRHPHTPAGSRPQFAFPFPAGLPFASAGSSGWVHHVPGWFPCSVRRSPSERTGAGSERLTVQTRSLGLIGILESFRDTRRDLKTIGEEIISKGAIIPGI